MSDTTNHEPQNRDLVADLHTGAAATIDGLPPQDAAIALRESVGGTEEAVAQEVRTQAKRELAVEVAADIPVPDLLVGTKEAELWGPAIEATAAAEATLKRLHRKKKRSTNTREHARHPRLPPRQTPPCSVGRGGGSGPRAWAVPRRPLRNRPS